VHETVMEALDRKGQAERQTPFFAEAVEELEG
jgi:hypothetical protein